MVDDVFSKNKGDVLEERKIHEQSKKKHKQKGKKKTVGSFYGTDDFDFSDVDDGDDLYGASGFSKPKEDQEVKRVTLQSLFEFKIWEMVVLGVEVLMIIYLALVVLRIIPMF